MLIAPFQQPHPSPQVQAEVNSEIARLVAWSMGFASTCRPSSYQRFLWGNVSQKHLSLPNGRQRIGPWLEDPDIKFRYVFLFHPLQTGYRVTIGQFALGGSVGFYQLRAIYFAMKCDLKARAWMNKFTRAYNCNLNLGFF